MVAFQKVDRKGCVTLAGTAYFVGLDWKGDRVRIQPHGGGGILADKGGTPRTCYPDDPTTEAHEPPARKPV